MTRNIKNPYAVAKCLRRRAVSTHSDAIGSIYKDFLISSKTGHFEDKRSFSQHPSSKTGIFEDGLYCAGIIFQEVDTNLQMSTDNTRYFCRKLKSAYSHGQEKLFKDIGFLHRSQHYYCSWKKKGNSRKSQNSA